MSVIPTARVLGVAAAGLGLGLGLARSVAVASAASLLAFVIALCVAAPVVPLLAVLPAAYGSWRVGPASIDLSIADAALVIGAMVALPFLPWRSTRVRLAFGGMLAYQAVLAVAVLADPSTRAILEWGHRMVLVGGALAVGAALANLDRLSAAIRWFLAASAAIAVAACVFSVTTGFAPAYPFGIHKNSAGLLLTLAFLSTIVAPSLTGLPPGLVTPFRLFLLAGVLASQSRGAMVAAIAGLAVTQLRGRSARRAAPLVIVAILAMAAVVAVVSGDELEKTRVDPNASRYTPIGSRQETNREALAVWSDSPLFGAGIRYFKDPARAAAEPHNIIVVTLAESGAVGIFALIILLGVAWRALRGLSGEAATLARVILGVRVLAAMFDIYWVAGRGSLPWVLVGGAVAVRAAKPAPKEFATS